MKKLYFYFFAILFLSSAHSQIVNIPDLAFKAVLLSANDSNYIAKDENQNPIVIDANQDGEIQISEALTVYSLGISDNNMTSLNGIEAFSNLGSLSLFSSSLMSLDEVQQMVNLNSLWLGCQSLTSVSLQQMHALSYLKIEANTPITELDLCGTSVFSLYCINHPTLQSINFKNNIVSGMNLGDVLKGFPPPLPNIWLENTTALQNVCYDEGEYPAIVGFLNQELMPNINFSTDCSSSCMLANAQNFENSLTLWPNPVEDYLHIESISDVMIQSAKIYNTLGQLIQFISAEDYSSSIYVADLKTGSYFLELISDQGKVTKKFMKL